MPTYLPAVPYLPYLTYPTLPYLAQVKVSQPRLWKGAGATVCTDHSASPASRFRSGHIASHRRHQKYLPLHNHGRIIAQHRTSPNETIQPAHIVLVAVIALDNSLNLDNLASPPPDTVLFTLCRLLSIDPVEIINSSPTSY